MVQFESCSPCQKIPPPVMISVQQVPHAGFELKPLVRRGIGIEPIWRAHGKIWCPKAIDTSAIHPRAARLSSIPDGEGFPAQV